MEWLKDISKFLKKQTRKQLIENAVVVIIIGIIIIIAGSTFFGGGNKKDANIAPPESTYVEASRKITANDAEDYEARLALILSKIKGAGRVDVMVTFISSSEIVPAYNVKVNGSKTLEKDKEGGNRDIDQDEQEKTIAYEDAQGGAKKPIVLKDLQPVVKGVVVVAEGAGEAGVREEISRAVQVLTDVPLHMVQVFERTRN